MFYFCVKDLFPAKDKMLVSARIALFILAATGGAAMAQNLSCQSTQPMTASGHDLCASLAAQVSDRSSDRFELQILEARDTHLRARLSATIEGRPVTGPELALTVMDRKSIPPSQLSAFATALIQSLPAKE